MASNLLRVTDQLRGYRPFIGAVSADVAEFSAGDVLAVLDTHKSSGTEHNWLYYTKTEIGQFLSYKADKARVWTAGLGLTGGGSLEFDRSFAIDTTAELSWTNIQHFQTILPGLTDTYDLGNMDLLWRKIWGSELSAVVLKEYEQFVMGGLWQMTKQEGAIEAGITAADTQVDFGRAMYAGDFVVFRSAGKVEYMSVGTPVIHTTYSVTRDLDGTGANDWPAGSVYAVLGKSGDGRIVFDAVKSPRMSIFSQGSAYNAQTEQLRFGDLNNNWGYPTQAWGVAIGEYASGKANLTLDPVNGLRLRNYQTDIIKLTGDLATFENWIQLGPNGGIRQGSGTWGTNFTGLAMWNVSGIGRIAGLNAGVMQAWFGSDGKFYAGAGSHILDTDGFSIHETGNTYLYKYYNMDGALISTDSVDTLSYQFQRKIRVIGGSGKYPNVLFQAVNGSATSGLEVGATTYGYARYSGAQFEFLSKVIIGDPVNDPFNLEVGGSIFLKGYNIGEWQTWTPTVSAGGGVFTNAAVTARYMVIGKTVFLKALVQIITNGTAATYVKLTLPIAAQSQLKEFVAGQAVSTSNGGYLFSLGCSIFPSTDLRIFSHDGTYPGADGRTLIVSGAYEIA